MAQNEAQTELQTQESTYWLVFRYIYNQTHDGICEAPGTSQVCVRVNVLQNVCKNEAPGATAILVTRTDTNDLRVSHQTPRENVQGSEAHSRFGDKFLEFLFIFVPIV